MLFVVTAVILHFLWLSFQYCNLPVYIYPGGCSIPALLLHIWTKGFGFAMFDVTHCFQDFSFLTVPY